MAGEFENLKRSLIENGLLLDSEAEELHVKLSIKVVDFRTEGSPGLPEIQGVEITPP